MALCHEYKIAHGKFLNWDQDDRDKALAYQRWRAEVCPQCGTRESDWVDDEWAYVTHTWHCKGCELLDTEGKDEMDGAEPGTHVALLPRELAIALEEERDEEPDDDG